MEPAAHLLHDFLTGLQSDIRALHQRIIFPYIIAETDQNSLADDLRLYPNLPFRCRIFFYIGKKIVKKPLQIMNICRQPALLFS